MTFIDVVGCRLQFAPCTDHSNLPGLASARGRFGLFLYCTWIWSPGLQSYEYVPVLVPYQVHTYQVLVDYRQKSVQLRR
jgi:hypothetical protein